MASATSVRPSNDFNTRISPSHLMQAPECRTSTTCTTRFIRSSGATVVLFELFTADTHFASKVVADTVFWGFRVVRFHSCDLNILSGVSTHQKQSERDSGTGVFSVRASLIADVNE